MFCEPYNNILPILLKQYARAIDTIGQSFKAHVEDVDRSLVNHLMAFFWRDQLKLEDEQGLLKRFFHMAPSRIRALAIETIGRWLYVMVPLQVL